jgi:prephenate dehydrogenase
VPERRRIAIIGLGLIGGSLALAIKRGFPDLEVAGSARRRDTAQRAKRMGAIDVDARSAEEAVRGASLVILAAPILAIRPLLEEIAPVLERGAVVTDCASTKAEVTRWAAELLPETAFFVGGHPMAGKEQSGIDAADADLFQGKPWVIAPPAHAPEAAVSTVIGLAQAVGARPIFMDPQEHDSYVAAISHLPLALASALFAMSFESAAWPELAALASSGFRDTTRLASGSPEMAHDIMITNRENVLHWIDRLQSELSRYREAIAAGDSKRLLETFARPQVERDNYMLNGPPQRIEPSADLPSISLSEVLLGTKLTEMMRRQESMIRASEQRAERRR